MGTQKERGVFIWNNYRSWNRVVLRLLADLIDESVFAELKRNPPRHFVEDNLSWLDTAIESAKEVITPDIKSTLSARFRTRYRFIRAFHGCRTDSIQPYLRHGLLPSDPLALNVIAQEIFADKAQVEAAIQDVAKQDLGVSYPDYNKGKIFFCLQMEELVEQCGHYLLYGS